MPGAIRRASNRSAPFTSGRRARSATAAALDAISRRLVLLLGRKGGRRSTSAAKSR